MQRGRLCSLRLRKVWYKLASTLTVSQINKYVAFKIKSDLKLKGIAVKGEISNFTLHYRSGHMYFTLKDTESSIKAVMFAGNARRLRTVPEDGMSVLVTGNLEVYEKGGVYQIIANDIIPLGAGELAVRTQMLKEKLREQGVFDERKKKPIPLVPKKISVVTSLTGAALQDILQITERRFPMCTVEIYPAQVQGESAPRSICCALAAADGSGADTLILARGGGSLEDLAPFNCEEVVMAVFNCRTPIVSAVGHETDTSLCDYAADMRAPTPSAAAEIATPDKQELLGAAELLKKKLCERMDKLLLGRLDEIVRFEEKLRRCSPSKKLEDEGRQLENVQRRLRSAVDKLVSETDLRFEKSVSELNALSPFNVLKRGYSITEKDGELADSAEKLKVGDRVRIRFTEDAAVAEIKEIIPKGDI